MSLILKIVSQADCFFFSLNEVLDGAQKKLTTKVKFFTDFAKFLTYFLLETPDSSRIKAKQVELLLKRVQAIGKGLSKDLAMWQYGVRQVERWWSNELKLVFCFWGLFKCLH